MNPRHTIELMHVRLDTEAPSMIPKQLGLTFKVRLVCKICMHDLAADQAVIIPR